VDVFFLLLMAMMVVSFVSFATLNLVPEFRMEQVIPDANMSLSQVHEKITKGDNDEKLRKSNQSFFVFCLLAALQAYLCFISNGFFPSIQVFNI
jgi:hypothetical protein